MSKMQINASGQSALEDGGRANSFRLCSLISRTTSAR